MTRLAALLLSLLTVVPCAVTAALEAIDLRPTGGGSGRQLLAANQCVEKGVQGTCNGCVCCCYDGGAGIVNYEPTEACTCGRVIKTSQIWATVVLSVILLVGGLLVQLYFGGSLPVSPYPTPQQRHQRQRSGRVMPDNQPPPQLQPQPMSRPLTAAVATV